MAAAVGWPPLWAAQPAPDAHLEAEVPVRKREEELDSRKARGVHYSASCRAGRQDEGMGVLRAFNPGASLDMDGANWPASGFPPQMA